MHYITPLAAYSFHSWYPVSQIATQDVLLEPYAGSARFYRCSSVSWRQRSRDLALMRSPLPRFTCKRGGDRRGSNPRPSLQPQSDATRSSPSCCVRSFGLFMGFLAILKNAFVRYVLACASTVAVRCEAPEKAKEDYLPPGGGNARSHQPLTSTPKGWSTITPIS
jgi:hypothetical protein